MLRAIVIVLNGGVEEEVAIDAVGVEKADIDGVRGWDVSLKPSAGSLVS